MRLEMTRRTDYAVRAMLVLARHPGVTTSTEIAQQTGIPVRFVSQVMAHLVRAELVAAVIGRSGGYRLAKSPDRISVLSIVNALEGDSRRIQCALRGDRCDRRKPCEIHHVFAGAQEAFVAQLAASTLASVLNGELATPSPSDASPGMPRPALDAAGSASRGSS
jgi:Rrf2 family iron-sulfur cluster assembly transcriptional regulator